MERVQTFADFHRISNEWNPVLTTVDTIEEAADNINFSHEDYPDFVESTKTTIENVITWLEDGVTLNEGYIKQIHKMCMKGKEYLRLGDYRMGTVIVNDQLEPPQAHMIPQMMMSIFPVGTEYQTNSEEIIEWYKKFETIHPFEDGNGRVGGVVLAAISYMNSGKYIVPKK
tara:strand:- start:42696 stop:43208 length:513 start_codon:yes stop_codon:yes gene_type:complete